MKQKVIPIMLTAILSTAATLFVAAHFHNSFPYFVTAQPNNNSAPVRYASNSDANGTIDFQSAAEASVKAVVHIKTTIKGQVAMGQSQDPFGSMFEQLFGQQMPQQRYYIPPQAGSGSGVVISPDGYIVTNNHVVENADEVTVTFNDRYTTKAKVIGKDASTDIAVLKVEEKNLSALSFGASDQVHLGQWVLAVGYPLSLDATVTAGIVSAKGRSLGINQKKSATAVESFIQTDAAVNPGNSGGALVNLEGQLIGINSAIASPTGSYAGYSYAIPADIVRKVVNDLMQYGSVKRGYLGIEYLDRKSLSQDQIKSLGIDKTEGVYVANVRKNSGAEKGGIKKGDFITEINGIAVNTESDLQGQIARYHPNDHISVKYKRNNNDYTTSVELISNASNNNLASSNDNAGTILGATCRALTTEEKKIYNIKNGVIITDIGRGLLAQRTNIGKNFIITSVNDKVINTVGDLENIINENADGIQIGGQYPGRNGNYYYGLNGLNKEAEPVQ